VTADGDDAADDEHSDDELDKDEEDEEDEEDEDEEEDGDRAADDPTSSLRCLALLELTMTDGLCDDCAVRRAEAFAEVDRRALGK
jgi:hypothetical protein